MAKYNYNIIKGTSKNDWLTGSYFDDDIIYAADGNDYLFGCNGADRLYGQNGNDRLYGGSGKDTLYGGADDDRLYGGSSNDLLEGGEGADYLNGGSGSDTASYSYSSEGVTVNLLNNTASGGDAEGDSFYSIENLSGSNYVDHLYGNGSNNIIKGHGSNDTIKGGGGNDILYGGDGTDYIFDEAGDDTVYGDAGSDYFYAGSGADDYYGGSGGFDQMIFSYSDAGVTVNLDTGVGVGGYAEGDTYDSIELIYGSDFADTLIGDDGDNTLIGLNGADVISGGLGDDTLWGDLYYGGYSDTFVFEDTQGLEADTILDFEAGVDKIDFTQAVDFFGFNDLNNGGDRYMEQDGNDTVIHYYDHTITLLNVDANQLSADDFLFA